MNNKPAQERANKDDRHIVWLSLTLLLIILLIPNCSNSNNNTKGNIKANIKPKTMESLLPNEEFTTNINPIQKSKMINLFGKISEKDGSYAIFASQDTPFVATDVMRRPPYSRKRIVDMGIGPNLFYIIYDQGGRGLSRHSIVVDYRDTTNLRYLSYTGFASENFSIKEIQNKHAIFNINK